MPKFTIIETVEEHRDVEADTAQEALERWLNEGQDAVSGRVYYEVKERHVEDADGNACETEEP